MRNNSIPCASVIITRQSVAWNLLIIIITDIYIPPLTGKPEQERCTN